MLPTVLTIIVLSAVGWVITTYIIDYKNDKAEDVKETPALPQRTIDRVSRKTKHIDSLPVRTTRTEVNGANRIKNVGTLACGPRGLEPEKFPCCPYCKQRNYIGSKQLITWDSEADCYRCSRGHCFRKNGRIL